MLTVSKFTKRSNLPNGRWKLKRTIFGTYKVYVEYDFEDLCAFSIGTIKYKKFIKATKKQVRDINKYGNERGWKHVTQ